MAENSLWDRTSENASGIAATVVTGTWLALLLLDFPSESSNLWLVVMLFGYIAVVPVVSMLFDEEDEHEYSQQTDRRESDATTEDEEDALERLRRRYADGELTDEQFERKLERLLETETLEDVESRSARRAEETATDRIPERDRN
jgi:hypothetical protein